MQNIEEDMKPLAGPNDGGLPQEPSQSIQRTSSTRSKASLQSRSSTPPSSSRLPKTTDQTPSNLLTSGSLRGLSTSGRPHLQKKASAAVSLSDVGSHGKSLETPPQSIRSHATSRASSVVGPRLQFSRRNSQSDDNASISSIRTRTDNEELETLLQGLEEEKDSSPNLFEETILRDALDDEFLHEFDQIDSNEVGSDEALMTSWRMKLKHFLILSSAGKPIYSRHGDNQVIANTVGVVQTIISSFSHSNDELRSITALGVRVTILSKSDIYLVAVSRLNEDDAILRSQLEALYAQIVSTLTVPGLRKLFANRPSTDLSRQLEGTWSLLSALADEFTRGSQAATLGAVECVRLRKRDRERISQSMLRNRAPEMLYGLAVTAGRLVAVVRPRKQSLHPGDLLLIFNMLFRAGAVRAGGGESWIPLCLPGFNDSGYVYVYVSFMQGNRFTERDDSLQETAIVLISASRDSFFEMRKMRDEVVQSWTAESSLDIISAAYHAGRPQCISVCPGTGVRHFLYKSRADVQYVSSEAEDKQDDEVPVDLFRRRLASAYGSLYAEAHGRSGKSSTHMTVLYTSAASFTGLAHLTPAAEIYCIGAPGTSRPALAAGARLIETWARKERERLFIIGGAVF